MLLIFNGDAAAAVGVNGWQTDGIELRVIGQCLSLLPMKILRTICGVIMMIRNILVTIQNILVTIRNILVTIRNILVTIKNIPVTMTNILVTIKNILVTIRNILVTMQMLVMASGGVQAGARGYNKRAVPHPAINLSSIFFPCLQIFLGDPTPKQRK